MAATIIAARLPTKYLAIAQITGGLGWLPLSLSFAKYILAEEKNFPDGEAPGCTPGWGAAAPAPPVHVYQFNRLLADFTDG
jgi:hypothetical protein